MNQEQPSIQSIFLTEFTKAIIAYRKSKIKKFIPRSHPIMELRIPKISSQKNVTVMLQDSEPEHKIISESPRLILDGPKIPLKSIPPVNQIKPIDWSHAGLQPPPKALIESTQQMIFSIQQLPVDKVKNLLMNPSIFSVECAGPSKPLVVVARGLSSVTNVILTEEEINALLQDISAKTRIPLVPGLFKTVFGSLLIIAVVSEFVGIRFIIQKRI